MKRITLLILALSLIVTALLSFRWTTNDVLDNDKPDKKPYETMWKQFDEHLKNSLPESAEKVLDSIERQAENNHDQIQLLKTILYRRKVMMVTVEEQPEEAYLKYALAQLDRLETVPRAVLHEEIAGIYSEYLNDYKYKINQNKAIDGPLDDVAMQYWDKRTFQNLIDQHYTETLKPLEELKKAPTEDYLCLFSSEPRTKYLDYEPTMFDFLFHRVENYYRDNATADDLQPEWDTQQWWLQDNNFAKADLGKGDNPLIKCLRIFQQLIKQNNNPEARLYNDFKRYEFVNGILKEAEPFQQAMRSLMAKYPDSKLYDDLANNLATSLIQQFEANPGNSALSNNYQEAADICREAIKRFPDNSIYCKSTLSYITHPHVAFELNQIQLPNENIPAVIKYRNVEHPVYRIIKVTEKELENLKNSYNRELNQMLYKKDAVAEVTLDLPAETDYREHSAIIALPPLKEGFYYLLANTGNITKPTNDDFAYRFTNICFQVSKLSLLVDSRPKELTFVTVDRKTGYPVEGVTIEATRRNYNYEKRRYETITVATLTSDKDGRAVMSDKKYHDSFEITLRKGDDVLLPPESYYLPKESNVTGTYDRTKLFTDRAIYRPGQTVYFKGISTHVDNGQYTLAVKLKEHVVLKDANWQEVASADFTTDEYGAFDGSFVIPTNLLNGQFQLEARHGSTSIRVEEYKRPTFEIKFSGTDEQYKLNQNVTVNGSVSAYAGFNLDDIQYSYRVVRKTSFPWRCWWWWYPVVEDEPIDFGEGRTDENGKFAITFNLKPSLKTKPEQQPVFTYEIEVTATSAQGETHADTYRLRAGYNEVALSTSIPDFVEQGELDKCKLYVTNMNGKPAKTRVSRKVYRFDDDSRINYFEAMKTDANTDRNILSENELIQLFPSYSFSTKTDRMNHKRLVYEDVITVNDEVSFFNKQTLKPGKYYIELKSLDDTLAQITDEFTVYQKASTKLPATAMTWFKTENSGAHPGETVRFYIGTSASDVRMWVKLTHGDEVRMERWITLNNEIKTIEYTVTEADRGGLNLQTAFVKENSYNTRTLYASVPFDNYDLNVSLATVRDKLDPGSEETWTVNVKDYKDKPTEAALMAGMYDVSLDEFAYHYWSFNMTPYGGGSRSFRSDRQQFVWGSTTKDHLNIQRGFDIRLISDDPFFYLYLGNIDYLGKGTRRHDVLYKAGAVVEDRVEMVVASAELAEANGALREEESVEEAVFASYDEDADMGASTATGNKPEEPQLRENFNETAFFFPNLRTEADGSSTFTFTMPDAITRWKLMMVAYTKDGKTGNKEYEFRTSKPVMIMADMPRYMYDTDTLWFVANVINTGDEAVTPKAKLEIFDAASMKPINLLLTDQVIPMKEIAPGRSKEVRWKVATKYDLSLLAFRFTAYAGQFSDAEQHLMPVLSSEIFLTQTLPITVKAETEKTFDFDAIANPNSHERDYSLTLNFSTNPVWYAVQSLPYLANINTNHPESAFYVFYANSLSAYIADHVPNLMAYIKKWQIETPDALLSQLEKDQDLKAIMLQETPWVLDAKSETEQRARIANLFDLNTLKQQQSSTLALLTKKQKYNGGWPWVDGMPESPCVTAYILEGFGKLKQMGVWESMNKADQRKADEICEKAVRFIENDIAERYREMKRYKMEWGIGGFTLHELYALSFFKEQDSDRDFATAKKYYLGHLDDKKEWTGFNFNDRAYAAMVLYRNDRQKTAKLIIKSFKECAQKNEELGMYWPKKYFSFISHVATHANIMTAFAEIDQDQELIDQQRVWLLTQKRTNLWENSASTAEAIYALLMRGSDWFEEGKDVTLSFSGTPISTEGGEAGTGFIQRHWNANEVTEDMRHLTVNNPTGHLVWGGLFRQYFVPIDEVKHDSEGMKIKRELFVETVTANGKLLVPIGKRTLKVGDKLTVKLTIESPQDMSYVFVKDLRAAGIEPIEQLSSYEYHDGMRYYQSSTDVDTEFFIDFLPKGIHQLEYSMFVTKEGNLSNGYALIQCQYAPEFGAYSDGMRIRVGK